MKYCADTWFLFELKNKSKKALELYKEILYGKGKLIIPSICIFELIRLAIRSGITLSSIDSLINEMKVSQKIQVIVLDENIAKEAAKVSVTFGVPTVDSIVAATFKISGCDILLSKDDDLSLLAKKKYLRIENW